MSASPVTINLKLHNRFYKIKVAAEQEELIRKTADSINEQLADFEHKYKGRDAQDYLALTMIARMTDPENKGGTDESLLIEEIEKIAKLLH